MDARIAISLGAILLCAGSSFAQTNNVFPLDLSPTPIADGAPGIPAESFPALGTLPQGKGNFWVFGDFLLGWTRGADLPALVTTSPSGTSSATAGQLGSPTTSTLFGGDRVNTDMRTGFRLGGGYWFGPDQKLGIEAGFMYLGNQSTSYSAASNGSTILTRPFTNPNSGTPDALFIAFPGTATGSFSAQAGSGALYETHLDIVEKSLDYGWFRLNSLIGYRFYSYNESLGAQQVLSPLGASFVPGTQLRLNDTFGTHNTFNGLDMGFRPQFFVSDTLMIELLGKVAFGNLNEVVNINGSTTVTAPGTAATTSSGGFYALPSNIGSYHSNIWYALPEGGASLNWQIRPNLNLRIGYSILMLQGVARAGDQIDTTLNPNLLPGATQTGGVSRPSFSLNRSDLWIQTVNLGVTFTY